MVYSKKFSDIVVLKECEVYTTKKSQYILREKSLAIYLEDSQFRTNKTFNFIMSKIYVDKRSRVR